MNALLRDVPEYFFFLNFHLSPDLIKSSKVILTESMSLDIFHFGLSYSVKC